jgi:hypothetical protein
MVRMLLIVAIVLGMVLFLVPDTQAGTVCDGKVCRVVTAPVRVVVAVGQAACVQKAGICHAARAGVRWYPGKSLIRRRQAAATNGGWYLGRNLGRACCR